MKQYAGFMLLISLLVSGCSRPPAEESFALAEAAEGQAVKVADTVRSEDAARALFHPVIDAYAKVIEDHPGHVLAEVALFRIATIRNNSTREFTEALDAYRQYVERYPDGKQTPISMFLIGYLYNNELHNTDSAAAAYRRFLAKYPDNEMALSAQFELSTLGKSPEELLPKEPPPQKPPRAAAGKKK